MLRWPSRSRRPAAAHRVATAELPFAALEAVRMQAKRRVSSAETGAHLRRRMGQSLEFREHRAFVPGDDIRHVDWRVSARIGGAGDLFVRQFDAEDRLEIVVVVDLGPTMRLPDHLPKAALAVLIARALLWCAERGRDRISLVTLGAGQTPVARLSLKGQGILARGEGWILDQLASPPPPTLVARMSPDMVLPTGGVCVLISDFYDDDPNAALGLWARHLQRRHGILTAIQLDTWATEATPLRDRNVLFQPVGDATPSPDVVEAEAARLARGEDAARAHVSRRLDALQFGGLSRLQWVIDNRAADGPSQWLADRFASAPDLANALVTQT